MKLGLKVAFAEAGLSTLSVERGFQMIPLASLQLTQRLFNGLDPEEVATQEASEIIYILCK